MQNSYLKLAFVLLLFLCSAVRSVVLAAELTIINPNEIQTEIGTATGQAISRIKIVFIPGILGSKLLKKGTVPGERNYVWGGNNLNDPDLFYDGKNKLEADFFDKIDMPLLSKLFDTNVYGQALLMLHDSRDLGEADILKFSYDWRQSNALSADDLNAWICKHKSDLKGNEIVFLAHSMGGLVLKNWFMNYYDQDRGCQLGESSWLDVKKVFFAGTPHLGAPKALAALVGKYSLYDNWFARHLLPDGVKNYGYSFDSFYELLPLQNDAVCQDFMTPLNVPRAIILPNDDGSFVDTFSIGFMENNDLPYAAGVDRQSFRQSRLRVTLPLAARLACETAKYKFEKFGLLNVDAFSGFSADGSTDKNTISVVRWKDGAWETETGIGDGTVLKSSSSWRGRLDDFLQVQPAKASHMKILDDESVKVKIQSAVQSLARGNLLQLQSLNSQAFSQVIAKLGAEGRIVWTPPDDKDFAAEARQLNNQIFQKRGMSVDSVVQAAKESRNLVGGPNTTSYVLNDYVANLQGVDEIQKVFAKNAAAAELKNIGYESISKSRYDLNIPENIQILHQGDTGQFTPQLLQDLRKTIGNALNNRGLILKNAGDFDGALSDFKAGSEFGSQKALNHLGQLQQSLGVQPQ